MILNCIQKGGTIYIYTDKGTKTKTGYLVGYTGSSVSYVSSKSSRTVIVVDDKLSRIKSFCSPVPVTGIGW